MNNECRLVSKFGKVWPKLLAHSGENSKSFHVYHGQKKVVPGMRNYAKTETSWNKNIKENKIICNHTPKVLLKLLIYSWFFPWTKWTNRWDCEHLLLSKQKVNYFHKYANISYWASIIFPATLLQCMSISNLMILTRRRKCRAAAWKYFCPGKLAIRAEDRQAGLG